PPAASSGEVAHHTAVDAPPAGVLKPSRTFPLSSTHPKALISSFDMSRWRLVMIPPGCTAYTLMPFGSIRLFSSSANRVLAVLDWPYASHLSYFVVSKFGSSNLIGDRRWPTDVNATTLAPFVNADARRHANSIWPR